MYLWLRQCFSRTFCLLKQRLLKVGIHGLWFMLHENEGFQQSKIGAVLFFANVSCESFWCILECHSFFRGDYIFSVVLTFSVKYLVYDLCIFS